MCWPQVGRSVAEGYPGTYENPATLNRYGYALDNPYKHIDPSGRLTIIVHGTFARDPDYARGADANHAGSMFHARVSATFGESAVTFNWSGGNSRGDRTRAAAELAAFISGRLKEGEPLNIVAHSHGGNVVKEYTARKDAARISTFVALGTPQRADYSIDRSRVKKYVNVYSNNDSVQTRGGGEHTWPTEWGSAGRTDSAASNVDVSVVDGVKIGHSDLHTDRVWNQAMRGQ